MALTKQDLDAFRNDWEASRETKDRTSAKETANALLQREPDAFKDLDGLSIPDLVAKVDAARSAGNADEVTRLDAYLLAIHPPQQILGRFRS